MGIQRQSKVDIPDTGGRQSTLAPCRDFGFPGSLSISFSFAPLRFFLPTLSALPLQDQHFPEWVSRNNTSNGNGEEACGPAMLENTRAGTVTCLHWRSSQWP